LNVYRNLRASLSEPAQSLKTLSALRQSASVDDPFDPGDLTICDNCLFLREHILQPAITTMKKKMPHLS